MDEEKRYSDSVSVTTVKIEVSAPLGSEMKECVYCDYSHQSFNN